MNSDDDVDWDLPKSVSPAGVFARTASSKTTSGGLRGKESITMFINSIDDRAGSFVFEFELKLAPQEKATAVSDAVFGGVAFAYAECHFKAQAMGGARVLGDGVYLVASGGGSDPDRVPRPRVEAPASNGRPRAPLGAAPRRRSSRQWRDR